MAAKKPEPITNLGWFFLIAFTVLVDILQIILDFAFGAGVIVNRIIDVGFAFTLLLIFHLKDIQLTPVQYGSIAAAFVGEEIPGIDMLPLWSLDVGYICASIKGQEVAEKAGVLGKVAVVALKAAKKGQGGDLMRDEQGALSGAGAPALPPPAPQHLPTNTVDLRPSGKKEVKRAPGSQLMGDQQTAPLATSGPALLSSSPAPTGTPAAAPGAAAAPAATGK